MLRFNIIILEFLSNAPHERLSSRREKDTLIPESNQIPFIILLFADVICAGNVVINSIWALGFHCLLMLVAFRQRCKQLVLVCEFI